MTGASHSIFFLDEEAECSGREDLGVRGDPEQCPGIDRPLAELANAVALRQDDLAILDDREREPRDFERLQRFLHDGVDVGRRRAG